MRIAYPPYDFLLLGAATFLTGVALRKLFFEKQTSTRFKKWVPLAIAYLPLSFLFAFIINDLPLKFYIDEEPVQSTESASMLGPQSITKDGLVFVGQYYLSIAFNFIVWLLSVYVVISYYTRKSLPFKTKRG